MPPQDRDRDHASSITEDRLTIVVQEAVRKELRPINTFINGDEKPHMGAVIRLDRLEQQNKRQAFWMGVIGTACVGGIALEILKRLGMIH